MEVLNHIIQSAILGVVQGLTEFLPISSSGHLIFVRDILGLQVQYGLAFDAVLQLATTLAILVYFRKEICQIIFACFNILRRWFQKFTFASSRVTRSELINEHSNLQKYDTFIKGIIIGSIPAIAFGLALEGAMDTIFRNSTLVAIALIVGAFIMWIAEKTAKQNSNLTTMKGFLIGFFQALALVPGMSRSGMTIAGGLFTGLGRELATRFSFLLALPVLLGSGFKKLIDIGGAGLLDSIGVELLIGFSVSFFVGIAAIHFLIKFLRSHSLKLFVWYRVALAIIILIVTLF